MINISLRFILCVFFLQYSLVADSNQSSGKKKQSHPHSSHSHKLSKKKANSLANSRRSGDCRKSKLCVKRVVRASWYGPGFHGHQTKCRERFNQHALTAASNTLACNTKVRLHYKKTGKSVVVRINDTGGFAKYNRDIDLSLQAAKQLDMKKVGHASLEMQIISLPKRKSKV